ncbi:FadR/GntR family transcriptional regulator [Fimbriiglobus ruber]|uniref:Transcriptional regulator, GntR family n=1 Tax=Fimbriiglobus ruber TaxID=1908690 RepID=A0A225E677_9BACT|nr:FCD domain-containing protein [Fimbriiglobus ruber]OWK44999.1 Transcriptional regulator, GntR family [Fimbriiglobus ruber]
MQNTTAKIHPDVARLIEYISSRKLAVGERLPPIKELAKEFGVQPHAVRDSVLQAQTMGLLHVRPRSGVYVRSVNFTSLVGAFSRMLPVELVERDASLLDVLEARRLIESELAGVAAARRRLTDLVPVRDALQQMYTDVADYERYVQCNEDFHLRIAGIAGNQVLLIVLRQLTSLMRGVLLEHRPANWQDVRSAKREIDVREHEAIYNALLAGDAPAARAAMQTHLRDTTESLVPKYVECGASAVAGSPSNLPQPVAPQSNNPQPAA